MQKTNPMRILDKAKTPYEVAEYEVDESDLSGVGVAQKIGKSADQVFKTLVLKGPKGGYVVCCIPSSKEIDLKKAAAHFGEKSLEMIPVKDIQQVTGYIRGGCSPIAMKKRYPTAVDQSVNGLNSVVVSAGVRGVQIILAPADLIAATGASCADITAEKP